MLAGVAATLLVGAIVLTNVQGQSSGDLRLVNTAGITGVSSGRLEIFINTQWGTICGDGFSSADAEVACRRLRFDTFTTFGLAVEFGYSRGSSNQAIWLDNLSCQGTEESLNACSHAGIGNHDCTHNQDVALSCGSDGSLRLQGGSRSYGRLEVFHNNQWGTVCDDAFNQPDADVACGQLGFARAHCWGTVDQFGVSQGSPNTPIWLEELECGYDDMSLLNCPHDGEGDTADCSHSEDVGVACLQRDNCDGNTFTNAGDISNVYYYTSALGVILCILLCLFFTYIVVKARSHGHRPPPPRTQPPPSRPPRPPPPQEPAPRVVRPSRFIATKSTWYTQPPPGYLTVVGSPAYHLEKSIRPGITLPPFEGGAATGGDQYETEGGEQEPPPYPEDMDELDHYPILL